MKKTHSLQHAAGLRELCCLVILALAATFTSTAWSEPLSHQVLIPDSELTIDQAINHRDWQAVSGDVSLGYVGKSVWLRYRIPEGATYRVFTVENPWLLQFDVFMVKNGHVTAKFAGGSTRPASERPIASSVFAYPLSSAPDEIYILDQGQSAVNYPVNILSATEFFEFNGYLNVFHGLYYGIVLIMILYNIALFFGTRDNAYVVYALYAFSLITFLSTGDGTGSMLLWSDSPGIQPLLTTGGWIAALVLLIEFTIRFLNLPTNIRTAAKVLRVVQAVALVNGLAILVFRNPAMFALQPIVTLCALACVFGVAILRARQRSLSAKIFLAANSMIVISGSILASVLLGWVRPGIVLQHAVHIGSILELSLLSMALVQRLRRTDKARWEAFQQSMELSRRNKELRTARALAEEHRQLQKSLQQAQKLKTIGQLAGGFAHDFNNILASILGFAELAQDKQSLADRNKLMRYLGEIQRAGQRGADLVKQLLVYSRNTPSEPVELNVAETVKQASDLLRGSLPATVQISTELPTQPIFLHTDPEQLQQMLVNLCINAAEAMNNRGHINIVLEQPTDIDLTCTSCLGRINDAEYVAIKIEDDGIGIKGNAAQLFTPFHTSKEIGQGTGLGLSVVHGMVHEHGGHIHAANRAEGGARFVLYLPVGEPQPVRENDKRILLIEDDPSVVRYLSELLENEALSTTVATLSTQALETFVANPNKFDLVIANYLMPQGTGLELAEDIHALRPDLPIILTTGNTNNLDPNELINAGINSVFAKPLNSEQLLAKIRGLLAA
jgi:signal transduction histidine kinase/CheY-like chemotaxis protein